MTHYIIQKHTEKLPHKQDFSVVIPGLVPIDELEALTLEIASVYRKDEELILINWWLETQSDEDDCWASSRLDKSVNCKVHLLSMEDYLSLVELAPSFVEGELGVWLDVNSHSRLLQSHSHSEASLEAVQVFADGSGNTTVCRLPLQGPLRFNAGLAFDEFHELAGSGRLSIHDPNGEVRTLHRWR